MAFDLPFGLRWEGDRSWSFSPAVILVVAMVYLIGLVPYAVVGGDSSYVQRNELLDCEAWAFNAERKATALNLGIFHPNPRNVFYSRLAETVSKALLPMVSWLVPQPLLQMSLSTTLMVLLWLESVRYPAFVDRMYGAIVQGSRLFAACTMLCGLVTVVIGDMSTVVPILLLLLSLVGAGGHTIYRVSHEKMFVRSVYRRATSGATKVTLAGPQAGRSGGVCRWRSGASWSTFFSS